MFLKPDLKFVLFCYATVLQIQSNLADPRPVIDEIESTEKVQKEHGLSQYHDGNCGGVLEARDELQIFSYRTERPTDGLESCVWTIHAINGGSVKINVTSSYFSSASNFLFVGYFYDNSYDNIDSFKWEKIPNGSTDPHFIEVPAPVAFVQYVVGSVHQEFGFSMTYKAGVEIPSPFKFRNYYFEGEYGIFAYPPEGAEQRNNERVSLVIKAQPPIELRKYQYPSQIEILYKGPDGSGSCSVENVNMFGFGASGNVWFKNFTHCSDKPIGGRLWPIGPRNDPSIFTFKSGPTGAVGGFELRWTNAGLN